MDASVTDPLDQVQWRSDEAVAEFGGIHSNTILFYFARSPFMDPMSNNATVFRQAWIQLEGPGAEILANRENFEARIRSMSGLEYLVVQEPAITGPGAGTGVWVIRKQIRKKRPGQEDELTILATFFVVAENVYMAPTLADILNNRLLASVHSMNKFQSLASTLRNFTPSKGYTYPQLSTTRSKAGDSQQSQASRENTTNGEVADIKKPTATSNAAYLESRQLEETLARSFNYDDEYMDDYPVTGQPGDFHLSTKTRVEKPKALPTVPATNGPLSAPTGKPGALTLPKIKTDVPTKKEKSSKSPKTPGTASGIPKPKRKKSKAIGTPQVAP